MDETLVAKYPDLEREHFWWSARRQLVLDIFKACFPSGTATVLDVGCGSGMTARMVAQTGADVVGIDMSFADATEDDPRLRLVEGNYLESCSNLGRFDFVMALDSVEHFESEGMVMAALAGNVHPGGKVLVTVPAYQWLWSSHDEQNMHYRRYTRNSLTRALNEAGLRTERVGYIFPTLVVPKAMLALAERLASKPAPSGTGVVGWPNRVAAIYYRAEMRVAAAFPNLWPFGTSVVAIATRPRQ